MATAVNISVGEDRATLGCNHRLYECIVDPRTSVWLPWWDAVTGLALIFTAIFTPYEVAYLPPPSGPISQTREIVVFWTNRFVDVIFLLDVLLNFFLAYPADAEQIMNGLELSRASVSVACRELRDWGLVTLEKPLAHRHYSACEWHGQVTAANGGISVVQMRGEAALLTRRITIRAARLSEDSRFGSSLWHTEHGARVRVSVGLWLRE